MSKAIILTLSIFLISFNTGYAYINTGKVIEKASEDFDYSYPRQRTDNCKRQTTSEEMRQLCCSASNILFGDKTTPEQLRKKEGWIYNVKTALWEAKNICSTNKITDCVKDRLDKGVDIIAMDNKTRITNFKVRYDCLY